MCVLNKRLGAFLEGKVIFIRKCYATIDHIFSLNAFIEILKSQKKKCVFIDFS